MRVDADGTQHMTIEAGPHKWLRNIAKGAWECETCDLSVSFRQVYEMHTRYPDLKVPRDLDEMIGLMRNRQ